MFCYQRSDVNVSGELFPPRGRIFHPQRLFKIPFLTVQGNFFFYQQILVEHSVGLPIVFRIKEKSYILDQFLGPYRCPSDISLYQKENALPFV